MTNSVAQPFTIMTRRRKHGGKWETYQMKEKIVPAACCLYSGEILVAGGYGRDDWTKRMDTVCCNLFPRPP